MIRFGYLTFYCTTNGEPHISVTSDAIVYYTGLVVWKPPSIYKSFCQIDIEYFPYDKQSCSMKFGGWSYNGFLLNMVQLTSDASLIETRYDEEGKEYQFVERGMDLSYFHPSLEWDLLTLHSKRHEQLYPGCCGQEFYIDITYEISLRRKTLFYTVNLVTPCALIAWLTVFVFYIPAIEHKITHSISVLVTLTVFYLVLIELIPPTSLVIPLIGQYILFTMFLVSFSIIISVVTVNWYRRDGSLHKMPDWMYIVFVKVLPKILFMEPPEDDDDEQRSTEGSVSDCQSPPSMGSRRPSPYLISVTDTELRLSELAQRRGMHPDIIRRMIDNISFIENYYRNKQKKDKISDLWCYVAMVTDRFMLITFSMLFIAGSVLILGRSPYMLDTTSPLSIQIATQPLSGDTLIWDGNLMVNDSGMV
ncbi:unnamed protein product [Bursaphelenchus okinawaensis]|uniref:Uncharacterized protein n=1 Tax=Bursaphelenchus okinawaensis TaxID=465554 RepID=A0A811LQ18_9BILA|nr:unnamed protein product [Bursaphelenchus okinawaensis]CAG9125361.1 unnamed protein product [Bursaphelenchus okinawaensis]